MEDCVMRRRWAAGALAMGFVMVGVVAGAYAMQAAQRPGGPPVSSYLSVNEEDFQTVLAKMRAAKPGLTRRQQEMLAARYDLEDRPVAGADLLDDSARPRRRVARPAGDDGQLLRPLQRDPEPETARGAAPAVDAVSPAAVQRDRRSPQRASELRCGLLRLSRERQHQR